jgi:hypothetical protein
VVLVIQHVMRYNNIGTSLDYGVFICMNCSGAHRALGPNNTRVKSTQLDTFQPEWVRLMSLGNTVCNQYW